MKALAVRFGATFLIGLNMNAPTSAQDLYDCEGSLEWLRNSANIAWLRATEALEACEKSAGLVYSQKECKSAQEELQASLGMVRSVVSSVNSDCGYGLGSKELEKKLQDFMKEQGLE